MKKYINPFILVVQYNVSIFRAVDVLGRGQHLGEERRRQVPLDAFELILRRLHPQVCGKPRPRPGARAGLQRRVHRAALRLRGLHDFTKRRRLMDEHETQVLPGRRPDRSVEYDSSPTPQRPRAGPYSPAPPLRRPGSEESQGGTRAAVTRATAAAAAAEVAPTDPTWWERNPEICAEVSDILKDEGHGPSEEQRVNRILQRLRQARERQEDEQAERVDPTSASSGLDDDQRRRSLEQGAADSERGKRRRLAAAATAAAAAAAAEIEVPNAARTASRAATTSGTTSGEGEETTTASQDEAMPQTERRGPGSGWTTPRVEEQEDAPRGGAMASSTRRTKPISTGTS